MEIDEGRNKNLKPCFFNAEKGRKRHSVECEMKWCDNCETCGWNPVVEERRKENYDECHKRKLR